MERRHVHLGAGLHQLHRDPPAALGAAVAYHRADVEDLLYGGYTDTGSPAAPSTTWIWNGSWTAG